MIFLSDFFYLFRVLQFGFENEATSLPIRVVCCRSGAQLCCLGLLLHLLLLITGKLR